MSMKAQKKRIEQSQPQSMKPDFDVRELQRRLKPKIHLWLQNPCQCLICQSSIPPLPQPQISIFQESSQKNHQWLRKILIGLTQKTHKTLKLFLPDILFLTPQGLQIFTTNKKDYRVMKFAGTTPIKSLYSTLLRLRKQYKNMLEQNFRKTMIDEIDPKYMHAKYYDRLLPSHFHDGDGCLRLNANKARFRSYVLHKNEKYILSAIEQHKMNEKEPFCTIRYSQGNWQLLNQRQFEMLSLMKIPDDLVYIQSYIKSRESQAFCFSTYTQESNQTNLTLFKKAQNQVLVLLEGISKYDEGFDDLENFQDESQELMKDDPESYSLLMTYKIVHFLSMVAQIYVRHIKIKWIINDIDNVYIQEIIQFATDQISKRPIRYKLPPTSQVKNFYRDSRFFLEIHRQLQRKKQEAILKVKEGLKQKEKTKQAVSELYKSNPINSANISYLFSRKDIGVRDKIDSKRYQAQNKQRYLSQRKQRSFSATSGIPDAKNQQETIPSTDYNYTNNIKSQTIDLKRQTINSKNKIINISKRENIQKRTISNSEYKKRGCKRQIYRNVEDRLWENLQRRKLSRMCYNNSQLTKNPRRSLIERYQTINEKTPRSGYSLQIKKSLAADK